MILASELLPGDVLPSLRALTKELKIGVRTNQAYTELGKGHLDNVQGKGCFLVKRSSDLIKEHTNVRASEKMDFAEGYQIVNGDKKQLTPELEKKLIETRTFATGYEALVGTDWNRQGGINLSNV